MLVAGCVLILPACTDNPSENPARESISAPRESVEASGPGMESKPAAVSQPPISKAPGGGKASRKIDF